MFNTRNDRYEAEESKTDRAYTVQNISNPGGWNFAAFDVGRDAQEDHTSLGIHHVESLEVSHDDCGRIDGITVHTADGTAHYVRLFR